MALNRKKSETFVATRDYHKKTLTTEDEFAAAAVDRRNQLAPLGVKEGDAIDRAVAVLQMRAANRSYVRGNRDGKAMKQAMKDYQTTSKSFQKGEQ